MLFGVTKLKKENLNSDFQQKSFTRPPRAAAFCSLAGGERLCPRAQTSARRVVHDWQVGALERHSSFTERAGLPDGVTIPAVLRCKTSPPLPSPCTTTTTTASSSSSRNLSSCVLPCAVKVMKLRALALCGEGGYCARCRRVGGTFLS